MKFLLSPLLFVLLFQSVDGGLGQVDLLAKVKWQKYTSADGRLSMMFPGEYAEDGSEDNSPVTYKIQCTNNEVLYYVGYTHHDVPLEDYESLAEVSLTSFATQLNGKVLAKEDFSYKKFIGKKATIQMEDGNWCSYRVLLEGQYQYQLIVIGQKENLDKAIADKFFDSMKIKN